MEILAAERVIPAIAHLNDKPQAKLNLRCQTLQEWLGQYLVDFLRRERSPWRTTR